MKTQGNIARCVRLSWAVLGILVFCALASSISAKAQSCGVQGYNAVYGPCAATRRWS